MVKICLQEYFLKIIFKIDLLLLFPNAKVATILECCFVDLKLNFKANVFYIIDNNPYTLKLGKIVSVKTGRRREKFLVFRVFDNPWTATFNIKGKEFFLGSIIIIHFYVIDI